MLKSLKLSLLFHSIVVIAFFSIKLGWKTKELYPQSKLIEIAIKNGTRSQLKNGKVDLRPSFLKSGSFFTKPLHPKTDKKIALGNAYSETLLFTESKVLQVFDQLASKIDQHLDYPEILAENGIQGIAVLDLYFDSTGMINEVKSRFSGPNSAVRGLLVKAVRKGIVPWYKSDAFRLNREQFKNQNYRAEFITGSLSYSKSELVKYGFNSYGFIRKRANRNICIAGTSHGAPYLDIACIGLRIAGAVKRHLSDYYQIKLTATKENLNYYDSIELKGINTLIRRT